MEHSTPNESKPGPGVAQDRRRFALALLCVPFTIGLHACDGTTSPDEFSDSTVPIRVHAGETFALRLESNASTGYSWRLARPPDSAIVQPAGSRYLAPDAGQPPGTPGSEVWTFRAAGTGHATIELEYVRPWETPAQAASVATFEVIVG
jgi:predicted secreted protein